jgi:hypothetical protein
MCSKTFVGEAKFLKCGPRIRDTFYVPYFKNIEIKLYEIKRLDVLFAWVLISSPSVRAEHRGCLRIKH